MNGASEADERQMKPSPQRPLWQAARTLMPRTEASQRWRRLQGFALPSRPMSNVTLEWTDALSLKQPQIDDTHHQMVDLINELAAVLSTDADPLPAFQRLLEHTIEHFGMEERWMAATGFEPDNCHSSQHKMVLNVMHEVVRHATELKDLEPMHIIVGELSQWLPAHAEMMDAALVFHMGQVGYDPATGTIEKLRATEASGISSCGSQGCN